MSALVLALSIDALLVGIAYSLREIKLSPAAYLLVGLITGGLMSLAILAGKLGGTFLTETQGKQLGTYLLLGVGLWQLAQGWQQKLASSPEEQVASFRLKPLGVVVQILRDPALADLNRSGTIDLREALLLGYVLGQDALGAGFAAALTSLSLWAIPATGLSAVGMLYLGCALGAKLEQFKLSSWLWAAPSLILIALGLWKL